MNRFLVPVCAVSIAVLLVPAIRHFREQPAPPPPAIRLSLTAPAGTELGAGDELLDAAISPTQHELVFVATRLDRNSADQAAGSTGLWLRRFDAQAAKPLPGTEGASLPAWKQTGNVVSFFSGSRLKLLNLKTGAVADVGEAPSPAGATWLRDGSLLFVAAPGPVRRLRGGRISNATRLMAGDTAHVFPVASAIAEDFIYVAVRSDGRRVVRLHSAGEETDLGTTAAHAALPDARWLLFVKDATLLVDYRDVDGQMAGHDFPLALDVGTAQRGRGAFVASADVLLHAEPAERPRQITWLDGSGQRLGTVADVGDYWQIRVSPDEANLAVTARDPLLRSLDVLKIPVQETTPSLRLTTSVGPDSDPAWSPDGGRLAFRSMQRGRPEVFVTAAAITPAAQGDNSPVPMKTTGDVVTDWRNGEILVQRRETTSVDLLRVQEANGAMTPAADSPFNETDGRWSPDGRWIAYVSDEPGRPDVYVEADVATRRARQRVSAGGGTHPRWTHDSRALLFLRGSTIMRTEIVAGGTRFGAPRPVVDLPGIRDFDVARRSGRIVALLPVQSDHREAASVILNWRALAEAQRRLLERKTPPKF